MKKFTLTVFILLANIVLFIQVSYVEISSNSPGWQDTKIKRSSRAVDKNSNHKSSSNLDVVEWTWNGVVGSIYSLINFDLDVLPVEAEIKTAYLSLYISPDAYFSQNSSASSSSEFVIKRIITPWNDNTVNWNNKPTTTNQNTVIVTNQHQNYAKIDVTNLIIDMIRDRQNSFGFMLSCTVQQKYRGLSFASSEHPNENLRPKLTITYTDPTQGKTKKSDD